MTEIKAMTTLQCRDIELPIGERTLIMGILNVTPDSFSDGGMFVGVEQAVERARQMVAEGADLIDIGGESTRPGAERVSLEEELRRVLPICEALRHAVQVPLSIDTYKSEVAERSLALGAHLINDVSGLKADSRMAEVIASYRCPVIIMHNRDRAEYQHFPEDVVQDVRESLSIASQAGIERQQIILDPGIGFAKSYEQNLQLLGSIHLFVELGFPVLLGTSRKRVVRHTIDAEADDCVEGTAATVAFGIAQGCDLVRVHDVRQMKRVALMSDAMMRGRRSLWTK